MRRIVSLIGCLALILTLAAATTTVNAAGSILFRMIFFRGSFQMDVG